MKFKTISVQRGGTVNQGNFNNIRFDVGTTVEIADGDDEGEAYEKLRQWVHARAKAEAKTDG